MRKFPAYPPAALPRSDRRPPGAFFSLFVSLIIQQITAIAGAAQVWQRLCKMPPIDLRKGRRSPPASRQQGSHKTPRSCEGSPVLRDPGRILGYCRGIFGGLRIAFP